MHKVSVDTTIIDANHGKIRLAQIWAYRDLLWLLVRRDFVAFYKQTIFGPIWFFIQPIFTTIVFLFLFNRVAGISTEGIPAILFYLSGITLWNYFSECLLKTSTVFKDNAQVFGKVYFPRIIIPLSIVLSNLIRFFIQFTLFLVILFVYLIRGENAIIVSGATLLIPIIIALMAILGLGIGMIISSLTTKYRDLTFLVSFGVQLLMYATTIAYPLSAAPKSMQTYIVLNPLTVLIEAFRFAIFGVGSFHWGYFLVHAFFAFLVLLIGSIIFTRVERSFMDTV